MKRILPTWTHLALALTVPAWLLAVPAAAQGSHVGGGGGGQAAAPAAPAPSSGGSGGGQASGGGGGSHVSGGGGGARSAGGGGGRTSGVAVSRGGDRSGGGARSSGGNDGRTSRGTAQRGPEGSTSAPHSGGSNSGSRVIDRSAPRDSGRTANGVPEYARPRQGRPVIGNAVPRTGGAPGSGGGTIIVPGYYGGYFPWGFAGLGFAGYYGGLYDPYFSGWADPYGGYGGYGGYDDPGMFSSQYPQHYDEGALRLKIKPNGAAVYVDGAYVGVVDEYDGIFQKLHLDAGPHRVEVRMPGFDTLAFDVRIEPDHTTTYHGELTKGPQ